MTRSSAGDVHRFRALGGSHARAPEGSSSLRTSVASRTSAARSGSGSSVRGRPEPSRPSRMKKLRARLLEVAAIELEREPRTLRVRHPRLVGSPAAASPHDPELFPRRLGGFREPPPREVEERVAAAPDGERDPRRRRERVPPANDLRLEARSDERGERAHERRAKRTNDVREERRSLRARPETILGEEDVPDLRRRREQNARVEQNPDLRTHQRRLGRAGGRTRRRSPGTPNGSGRASPSRAVELGEYLVGVQSGGGAPLVRGTRPRELGANPLRDGRVRDQRLHRVEPSLDRREVPRRAKEAQLEEPAPALRRARVERAEERAAADRGGGGGEGGPTFPPAAGGAGGARGGERGERDDRRRRGLARGLPELVEGRDELERPGRGGVDVQEVFRPRTCRDERARGGVARVGARGVLEKAEDRRARGEGGEREVRVARVRGEGRAAARAPRHEVRARGVVCGGGEGGWRERDAREERSGAGVKTRHTAVSASRGAGDGPKCRRGTSASAHECASANRRRASSSPREALARVRITSGRALCSSHSVAAKDEPVSTFCSRSTLGPPSSSNTATPTSFARFSTTAATTDARARELARGVQSAHGDAKRAPGRVRGARR